MQRIQADFIDKRTPTKRVKTNVHPQLKPAFSLKKHGG
jgi:hypothetical protein